MATFNGEKYLRDQLDSLAAQTVLPSELVVTDDGSSDDTLFILGEFSLSAPFPVKVYHNEQRLGYKENFLKAVSLSSGELVAYCDQDDVWLANKIEVCAKAFQDPDVVLCLHSATVLYRQELSAYRSPDFKKWAAYACLTLDPLSSKPGYAMLFSRSLLTLADNRMRPRDIWSPKQEGIMMAHDEWVWYLACIFGKVVTIPDSLCLYRQHETNTCGFRPDSRIFRRILTSLRTVKYNENDEMDLESAAFLADFSESLREPLRSSSLRGAAAFRSRARMKRLRSEIYDRSAGFAARFSAFCKIIGHQGYGRHESFIALGRAAMLKDFLFGVFGFYKIVSKR